MAGASRLLVIALIILWRNLLSPYDTSTMALTFASLASLWLLKRASCGTASTSSESRNGSADPEAALKASILFCFNPASIFYSSINPRSLKRTFKESGALKCGLKHDSSFFVGDVPGLPKN
ncbi:hypothetical protein LguiB_035861 [Lonicera macranthoides]